MKICLIYDCLYPHTIGGAERWYREIARRLAADGHDVTYLTLQQWDASENPAFDGVRVVTGGPRMELYVDGRRRILPPLVFGFGVLRHLVRHGRDYDVVHTASFPYFSLLAAGLAQRRARYRLVVDWHEVWTSGYWREYLGGAAGRVGALIQRVCARLGDRAFCFSRLHAERLRAEGFRREITVLEGEYAGSLDPPHPRQAEPLVVFAGRHIPEKGVLSIPPAMKLAHDRMPELRCEIFGDGPQREELLRAIDAAGLDGAARAPGFVEYEEVDAAMRRALCMLLPSRREGYGLVVVEASARGTPSVVVNHPDNAATELVDDGENGYVAASDAPEDIAAAILRVHEAGDELRRRTAAWFERNARRLSIETSLDTVAASYSASARS